MIFGYDNDSNGIQDEDIVTVMLMDRDFPPAYKKKLAEKENSIKENTELLGVKIEASKPSIKDGGITYHFAIIEKYNDALNTMEPIVKVNDTHALLPDYNVFGIYIQNTPEYIFERKQGFPNVIKGGLNRLYTNSKNVVIGQHFPSTYVEKDWETGVRADEVDENNLEANAYIVSRENKRLANWKKIIDRWHQETEETALDKLEDMVSSRLLLYKAGDYKKPKYLKPQKGMCFKAKVKKVGRYMDLIGFEYDKDLAEYIYYSIGTALPEAEDLAVADMLIEAKDIRISDVEVNMGCADYPDDDFPF